MNKPDAIDIAVRDGMEALIESGAVKSLEKTGRAFCPVHGLVGHRVEEGWSVASEENGKRKWTIRPEPPVKYPLCEAE